MPAILIIVSVVLANDEKIVQENRCGSSKSHPEFNRAELCRRRQDDPVEPDDEAPVWSVFTSPDALQHAMTAQVRAIVKATYGVEIVVPTAV